MIITTPKIDDMSDSNTLTMNNTLANAQITADFSYKPSSPSKAARSSTSTSSIASSNTTAFNNENTAQPRQSSSSSHQRRASVSVDGYVARVGFDTLGCNDTSEYAFTLQTKTDNWKRTQHSRTFLVGTDLNDYSAHALQWTMENMVEDGDEIVALRVVPMELRDSLSKTGIPSFQGQESAARQEANKLMGSIRERNLSGKDLNIVVECMVGNVRDTIQYMIKLYQPDMLVVGTRGRSSVKGFLLGSVSRYCLHHSSVPVIVVRPERKLNKSKNKSKGIFRRRSSVIPDANQGYQPHPTQPIHMSTSDFDLRSGLTFNGSHNTLSSQSTLFPSATIHAGDRFPGRTSPSQKTRPLSSLFAPNPTPPTSPPSATAFGTMPASTTLTNPAPSPAQARSSSPSSSTHTSATLPPQPVRSPAPPPPEGMLKMKKSLTTDGTGKGNGGRGFGRSSGGFLSGATLLGPLLGKSGDKDKDNGGGFMKSKKRNSHGG
ncbi:hypothetical protein EDD11_004775 [Mortierella claussenii]|nr:hypothetical protein EDD11_004775 [Mortierella claussenii]